MPKKGSGGGNPNPGHKKDGSPQGRTARTDAKKQTGKDAADERNASGVRVSKIHGPQK